MRGSKVWLMARAELELLRRILPVYAALVTFGAVLTAVGDGPVVGMGASLLLAAGIGICFHLPILAVQDAIGRTRAFAMSLPVLPMEYAAGKLVATIIACLVPACAAAATYVTSPSVRGMLPPEILVLVGFAWFTVVVQSLGIALISESMGVTMTILGIEMFVLTNIGTFLGPERSAELWNLLAIRQSQLLLAGGLALFLVVIVMATLRGFEQKRCYA
ncbi:MAG: hypothetical protein R3E97_15020 [Candidatus Eisenbacteria bacterium]